MILGEDYIDSFLTTHFPYDYAKEPIIYPRTNYWRVYRDEEIKTLTSTVWTKGKGKAIRTRLKKCKPSLLEYHLRESTKNPFCECESYFDYQAREEYFKYYGPRWILTTYYDDSIVDFIQIDIDRHGEDDTRAKEQVEILENTADKHNFDIVWTTSPGSLENDGSIKHGLYAWIRLDTNHFVMDIREVVLGFLNSIGLTDIAKHKEGAYLKQKKLVRLPGQFNVELANPSTFDKINHSHTPIEANKAFQDAWLNAQPLKYQVLHEISQNQPSTPHSIGVHIYTHSSVPLSPLTPSEDTFTSLLKWGRAIVNEHYPNEGKKQRCIEELMNTATQQLPECSQTRCNNRILTLKAKQVVDYLWNNTCRKIKGNAVTEEEDKQRFEPHSKYISEHRTELLEKVKSRDKAVANQLLDLLVKHNGRLAVVQIYHTNGDNPVCSHYRQWRRIRDALGLVTLVDYTKPGEGKGTCKQYGFKVA